MTGVPVETAIHQVHGKGQREESYLKPQVRELVETYDPAVMWFDGEWIPEWTHEMGLDLYTHVRSQKPDILIHNLVDIAAKGGNYLLNVGPTAEGLIPSESVERLAEMGDWMDVNGEAIYGSRLWAHYEDGDAIRYTHTGNEYVYAVSLDWPGRELSLHHVRPEAGSEIYLLGYDESLTWSFDASEGLTITLPEALQEETERPCKYAYSFKIEGGPLGGVGQ